MIAGRDMAGYWDVSLSSCLLAAISTNTATYKPVVGTS